MPVGNDFQTEINIKEGYGISEISHDLSRKGVIKSAFIFKFYAYISGKRRQILPGTYKVNSKMSIQEITDALANSKMADNKFVIVEGWRLEQVGAYLTQRGLNGAGFIQEAKNPTKYKTQFSFLKKFNPKNSLEGFLFPDTYEFFEDSTAEEIVSKMLETFQIKVYEKLSFSNNYFNNPYDVLKLASIIEREVPKEEDRSQVAGLYINRLKLNMKLDADPTVQYQKESNLKISKIGDFWTKIKATDYQKWEGNFNTYLTTGLPQGPICSPGLSAIESVINYAQNDYYYFFHDSNGQIYFSENYSEHLDKIKKYLK